MNKAETEETGWEVFAVILPAGETIGTGVSEKSAIVDARYEMRKRGEKRSIDCALWRAFIPYDAEDGDDEFDKLLNLVKSIRAAPGAREVRAVSISSIDN